ncbi:hypothetical protein RB653_008422 [Dictyostelium firmibasis]|uniref:SF4 helicase domain-containing protein n=1 Tax=Dictyostelium firmibasis TaxID=79012 RepID=A0AAN7YPB6_9MYCE
MISQCRNLNKTIQRLSWSTNSTYSINAYSVYKSQFFSTTTTTTTINTIPKITSKKLKVTIKNKDKLDIPSKSFVNTNNNGPSLKINYVGGEIETNTTSPSSPPAQSLPTTGTTKTTTFKNSNDNDNDNENNNSSTFVSSHYKVNEESMLSYLDRKKMVYKIIGKQIIVKECPLCHDTKGKFDNFWKLYISRETAAFFCHRCGCKGSWIDLKVNLGDLSLDHSNHKSIIKSTPSSKTSSTSSPTSSTNEEPTVSIADLKKMLNYSNELNNHQDVIKKLTGKEKGERGLSKEVLDFYKVGVTSQQFFFNDEWQEHKCITFPWTSLDKKGNVQVHRCKLRSTKEKSLQRIEPKGGKWGFFGWHTVPLDAKEIILTEGEYDAMAVYQETRIPTISLPNGANSLPIALLPMLERFEKIYLWMDDDVPGMEGAAKFSEKLGIQRTFIVSTKQNDPYGPKDANDALLANKDLNKILSTAANIPHDQICDFSDVRSIIHNELKDPLSVIGKQSKWFPSFNKILKGHRKGELTIFSGPTGIGKTSVLSQLSLDFCSQGTRTLWGSFELKVPRLARKMLSQFSNCNLDKHVENYQEIADNFSNMPMYFLRFFGSTQVDKVIDAMEYAVYVQDVEHIVLDNLQFMLGGQAKGIERYEIMDDSIEKLRKFASQKNVHITLVIHPRKQDIDQVLNINDIFGTAKATQEADNVIILQNGKNNSRYLDIKKNRFSGDLGIIPLSFEKETSRFGESNEFDNLIIASINNNNNTNNNINNSNSSNKNQSLSN